MLGYFGWVECSSVDLAPADGLIWFVLENICQKITLSDFTSVKCTQYVTQIQKYPQKNSSYHGVSYVTFPVVPSGMSHYWRSL